MAKKKAKKVARKKVSKKASRKARQQLIPDSFEIDEEIEELIAEHDECKGNLTMARDAMVAAYDSLKAEMRAKGLTEYHSPHLGRAAFLTHRDSELKVKSEKKVDED